MLLADGVVEHDTLSVRLYGRQDVTISASAGRSRSSGFSFGVPI